jgi:hypothetical protein
MKRTALLLALALLLLLSGVVLASLPGMAVDWWVMGGGEEARSGGPLRITGTIGQPAIGRTSAGPLALSGGYWYGAPPKGYLPLLLKQHS